MIKVYYPILLCSSTGLLHPSQTTSSTSIEWQLLTSHHKAIFSHEWPSYLQLKKFKYSWTLRSSTAIQAGNLTSGITHLSRSSSKQMYFVLVEITYLNFFSGYIFKEMYFADEEPPCENAE